MYNLDLKCSTKKNSPNCSIHLQSENPFDPRLTLSWPRTQLNTISEVRVVVFCFLFQQRSSSWIFLGDVFGWQRMCLLLVCIKKNKQKTSQQLCMHYFPSFFAVESMKQSSFVWHTALFYCSGFAAKWSFIFKNPCSQDKNLSLW